MACHPPHDHDGACEECQTGDAFVSYDPSTAATQEPPMTDHRTEAERLLSDSVRHTDTGDIRDAYIATARSGQSSASALLAIYDLLDERLPDRQRIVTLGLGNLDALKHELETPMREHGECCEPASADDLPGEPVEPGDLRAGDRVAFTWEGGARFTYTLASDQGGDVLRSGTPDRDDYYPNVTIHGREWRHGVSDVRLIERAPREDGEVLAMDLYHASLAIPPATKIGSTAWDDFTRQKWLDVARAARKHIAEEGPLAGDLDEADDEDAKAMHATMDTHLEWDDLSNVEKDAIRSQAERMAQHFDTKGHLAAVRKARDERDEAIARAESWRDANSGIHAERDAALDEANRLRAERDEWKDRWVEMSGESGKWRSRHAALREDVDALRCGPKSLTDVLMRAADALDRDDERAAQRSDREPDATDARYEREDAEARQDDPDIVTLRREGLTNPTVLRLAASDLRRNYCLGINGLPKSLPDTLDALADALEVDQ